ncbi:pentatricopeptide repeat-containing protein At5g66520-like [Cannabis sativa]|uniref:pentatricopeptide repeat-containing protein At5g66520-like n=1 Tax=Cannabis sativa TaxID=3483 RepID=UPI0029CA3F81|nr:pentatricopeptide repeat-containing protein At5g66520-like [Cannabis sativa]
MKPETYIMASLTTRPPSIVVNHKIPPTVALLQMCCNFHEVRQVHAQLVISGLLNRPPNGGRLVESYVRVSNMNYAMSVFDTIQSPDVFAYNNIIRGFMLIKDSYSSLLMLNKLLLNGFIPDNYTYTFVLKACSQLKALCQGMQVHCMMIKAGISVNSYTHSSLIRMYASAGSMDCAELVLAELISTNESNASSVIIAKNAMISGYLSQTQQGHVDKARTMFDEMEAKDVATWSAMISGYNHNAMYAEALSIFEEMMASRVLPNESTLVSSLSACAHLGALDKGRWIHGYVDKNCGGEVSVTLGTALVDMYVKCGCLECGYQVFKELSHRDVVTWGAMLSGFAIHGKPQECFQLFDEMVSQGLFQPNGVVFVAILTACSHAGFVELGHRYFNRMVNEFGIVPSIEHYGCMVDLLGRAGRLAEAEDFISRMPKEPNSIIWGAFLSACRTYKDTKRGNVAFKHLTELEPMSGDRYKLARLMFHNTGEKEIANAIRKFIDENDLETTRGVSFIEIDGVVNEFVSGIVNHDRNEELYTMWERVNRLLKTAKSETDKQNLSLCV